MKSEILERNNADFNFSNSSLAIGSSDFFDFESKQETDDNNQQTQDYAPFRNITLENTSSAETLRIYFNGNKGYKSVPAGVILDLENREISMLKIENPSGSAAASYTLNLNNDVKLINVAKAQLEVFQRGGLL